MTGNWIEEQRNNIKSIYERCRDNGNKEPILEAFSIYLLKILNGLSQMESSNLCGYEMQILGQAMRLFCIHYAEQVEAVLQQNIAVEEKQGIIEDIQDAISKVSNVYKNVIDSTANSDRQMFTSQAVETNLYDLSPKLFATYSAILETLVRLFGKEDIYAFLLHPSLKSSIETTSLFDLRDKEGKVVLIYIPENEIERVHQIPVYLLHEAFHVLTKAERNRKDRACRMEIHVLNAISQRIFKNIDLSFLDSAETAEAVKEELKERWFPVEERIDEIKNMGRDDRQLYSKVVTKQICEKWRVMLANIFVTLGKDLQGVFKGKSYKKGREPYGCIMQMEWEIQRNLIEILAGNLVSQYVSLYMTIYRETYADVACILTTGISPADYESAFKDSENLTDAALERDVVRALRVHTVAKAIIACNGVSHYDDWFKYSEEHDFRRIQKDAIASTKQIEMQTDGIQILEVDLKSFEDIMISSSEKLWSILGEKDSAFDKFRNIIEEMDLVSAINGKTTEELQKLAK